MSRLWAVGVLSFAGLSCGGIGPAPGNLEEHRTAWEALGIRTYSFEFQRICYCIVEATARVRVTVTNGSITSVTDLDTGQNLLGVQNLSWPSVDSLFAIADDALRNAGSVTIAYDAEFHFPSDIDIDWIEMAVDDEIRYTARGFAR